MVLMIDKLWFYLSSSKMAPVYGGGYYNDGLYIYVYFL